MTTLLIAAGATVWTVAAIGFGILVGCGIHLADQAQQADTEQAPTLRLVDGRTGQTVP